MFHTKPDPRCCGSLAAKPMTSSLQIMVWREDLFAIFWRFQGKPDKMGTSYALKDSERHNLISPVFIGLFFSEQLQSTSVFAGLKGGVHKPFWETWEPKDTWRPNMSQSINKKQIKLMSFGGSVLVLVRGSRFIFSRETIWSVSCRCQEYLTDWAMINSTIPSYWSLPPDVKQTLNGPKYV